MDGRKKWVGRANVKGVREYELSHWKHFSDFVNREMLDYTTYVYRGHANQNWKLEPTLDRLVSQPESDIRAEHLDKFKYETRGRRGASPTLIEDENDWWALGQHHGLATPLLDWTESPFVALFFAGLNSKSEKSEFIAIYALAQSAIHDGNERINRDSTVGLINKRKPTVKIVRPLSDENNRLVSQRGLFTRGPNNMDIESWIQKVYDKEVDGEYENLIRVLIPNKDMDSCLRYLNRMNINSSTLFPDLSGASKFCNTHIEIDKY